MNVLLQSLRMVRQESGIPVPKHIIVSRAGLAPGADPPGFEETEDYVAIGGARRCLWHRNSVQRCGALLDEFRVPRLSLVQAPWPHPHCRLMLAVAPGSLTGMVGIVLYPRLATTGIISYLSYL